MHQSKDLGFASFLSWAKAKKKRSLANYVKWGVFTNPLKSSPNYSCTWLWVSQSLSSSNLYLTQQRQGALQHWGRNEDVGSLWVVHNIAGSVLVGFFMWCSPGNSNPDCIVLILLKGDGDLIEIEKFWFTNTFRNHKHFLIS